MKKLLFIILGIFVISSCYTTSFKTKYRRTGVEQEKMAHFFLWGLVPPQKEIDLDKFCPDGVSDFKAQKTFLDGFLTFITIGIYSPKSVFVYCGKKPRRAENIESESPNYSLKLDKKGGKQ